MAAAHAFPQFAQAPYEVTASELPITEPPAMMMDCHQAQSTKDVNNCALSCAAMSGVILLDALSISSNSAPVQLISGSQLSLFERYLTLEPQPPKLTSDT